MKNLIYFIVLILSIVKVYADPIQDAAKLYKDSKFNDAAKVYQGLVNEGYHSAELYYNLGNAYFKSNELAKSIVYYEKARKLNPLDEDIFINLSVANKKTIDKVEVIEPFILIKWWNNLVYTLPLTLWAIFVLILLSLLVTLVYVLIAKQRKPIWFNLSVVVLVLLTVSIIAANEQYNAQNKSSELIIMESTVQIKSAPAQTSKDLFTLHEGTKASIITSSEGWINIKLPNGNEGWVNESLIETI